MAARIALQRLSSQQTGEAEELGRGADGDQDVAERERPVIRRVRDEDAALAAGPGEDRITKAVKPANRRG